MIEKVTHSDWATPIVSIPKSVDYLRICGDYKGTINHFLDVDAYPLPKPGEDIQMQFQAFLRYLPGSPNRC